MNTYRCFTRTWWKENRNWPNGLEPCPGERHYLPGLFTYDEAMERCEEHAAENDPGRLSLKMEFEES